jgi:hypothetical protein
MPGKPKNVGSRGDWKSRLVDQLPWKKLRRYELTNILWSCIALFFTVRFGFHQSNQLYAAILLAAVIAETLVCVMWACKQ